MSPVEKTHCDLCRQSGGDTIWHDPECRVVLVGGAEGEAFPGFCRVIWREHVREMSDLNPRQQAHLMKLVVVTERTVRELMHPDKINLASLGNLTPHLHWHVIPRWENDSHFPAPIWTEPRRTALARPRPERDAMHAAMAAALVEFSAAQSAFPS
jgi:diadenosine tetraphosphate (Ap4A) HIT family hydrolase